MTHEDYHKNWRNREFFYSFYGRSRTKRKVNFVNVIARILQGKVS